MLAGANKATAASTGVLSIVVAAIETHLHDADVVTAVIHALAAICDNHGDGLVASLCAVCTVRPSVLAGANKAAAGLAGCFDVVAEAIKVHQHDSAFVQLAIHCAGVFGCDGD